MNKKKILSLVLVVVLLVTAVSGTLAYFTDTEEATNVFTVGSVDIRLLESQYYTNVDTASDADIRNSAENYQAYLAEAGKNVVPGREFNKAIYIDNVGDSPAYVRVRMIVTRDQFNSFYFTENTTALEDGTLVKGIIAHYPGGGTRDYSEYVSGQNTDFTAIKADAFWTSLEYVYTYTAPLAAGDLTDVSPVWKFTMKNLDNEDVVKLKANTSILVYADAIQSEGFADYKAAFAAFADQKDLIQGNVDTWDGTAASDFGPEEDGTYVINSAEDFAAFIAAANGTAKAAAAGNTFEGATVKLNANVIVNSDKWSTINSFAGTFDGQGYTIFGLDKNLFGTVSGTVKNLNVNGVTIVNATKNGANGFINTVADGGLIDNCTVSNVDIKWTAGVNAVDTTDGFGGVICQVMSGATVQNCEFSDITVTSNGKTKRTGGVFDGITGTVKDCVFTNVNFTVADTDTLDGWVTSYGGGFAAVVNGGAVVENCEINNMQVNVDDGGHLGGIFGKAHINGQTASITLKNITVNGLTMNVGNARYGFTCVAGFIAQPDSRKNDVRVTIDNCHIYGLDMTLTGKQGESAAAGFISGLCGGVDVTNCSVTGKIDGTNTPANIGGFIGDAGWYGSIEQNFTKCVAKVDITVKNSIAGGFIAVDGTLSGGTATLNFTSCQATGTVTVVDGGTGTAGAFRGKTVE